MKIAFRADASVEIGTGHVMRCLTLADALRERGGEAHFICRAHPGHLGELIEARGHRLHLLARLAKGRATLPGPGDPAHSAWLGASRGHDARQTAAILGELGGVDWLVVDHYALDARWEDAQRKAARRILAIDDLADREHDCDLLLDQNYFLDQEERYRGRVPSNCRRLLGPRYALLRPEFAALHQEPRGGEVRRVLVYFGGVDAQDLTSRALTALEALGRDDPEVEVVIGAAHPNRAAIERKCNNRRGWRLHPGGADMAGLIAGADLAIGAGGASTWERACLGLPSIVVCLAENQRRLAEDLAAAGGCLYLGDAGQASVDEIEQSLRLLCANRPLRQALGARSAELVDGRGTRRVVGRMLAALISLRRAVSADCSDLFRWRNAEETRRHAHDDRPIEWNAHEHWLKETLQRRDRLLLIGELDGRPVGVLRYDLDGGDLDGGDLEGERATVSVYIVPDRHGAGLGSGLIEAGSAYLAREAPQVRKIVAEIRAENTASCKAFEAAGYHPWQFRYSKQLK